MEYFQRSYTGIFPLGTLVLVFKSVLGKMEVFD